MANYSGDGFQAYFGYPTAREDSATDAVLAAGQLQVALNALTDNSNHRLTCRTGIATGHVVLNQTEVAINGHGVAAFGPATHLAAGLERAASAGTQETFVNRGSTSSP